jgi:hypothetical protein
MEHYISGRTAFSAGDKNWQTWTAGPMIRVSNLTLDFPSRTVRADFESKSWVIESASYAGVSLSQKTFWSGTSLTSNAIGGSNSVDLDDFGSNAAGLDIDISLGELFYENGPYTGAGSSVIEPNSGLETWAGALGIAKSIQRSWSGLDMGLMRIHSPAAVPEPATWALWLMGLFGVGAFVRFRRRSV